MAKISDLIIQNAIPVRNYAEKLLKDIKAEDFSKQPEIGGKLIDSNHPAFVYGHLSLYPWRISKLLDLNLVEFEPEESYFNLFNMNAKCVHDPERKIYPPMERIVPYYFKGLDAVLEVLPTVNDERLLSESTDERSKSRFPILGSFIMYLLNAHPNGHLGQISVWRRCMGLGPA